MASAHLGGMLNVYGDQVFTSKDLNRRSREVLDEARRRPVTISRNGEHFALLKREQAADLVQANSGLIHTVGVVRGVLAAIEGREMLPSLAWLKAFGIEDLRQMTKEILDATDLAVNQESDWESVEQLIHQWHESALVASSGILDRAKREAPQMTLLQDPRGTRRPEDEPAVTV